MVTVGIDLSLRNTGIVILEDGELIGFHIVASKKGCDQEDLLIHNVEEMHEILWGYDFDNVNLEALSITGRNGQRDLIEANWWLLRVMLKYDFTDYKLNTPTVGQWRKYVGNRDLQKKYKAKFDTKSKKIGLKKMCVHKLPSDVRNAFRRYIKNNKFKKDSIYDLTDAYFVALYGGKK